MSGTPSCVLSLSLKAQNMMALRATAIRIFVISLLLSVVSVDGAYRGVSKRKDGLGYHCEVFFRKTGPTQPRVRIWVGTYPTEALAALACDVVFYYTNRPSNEFNLGYSEDAILSDCKPRSFYENLQNWNDRKRFIRTEANALILSLSDFSWEDVVPPSARQNVAPSVRQEPEIRWEDVVPMRQRAGEIAWRIVAYFQTQPERLRQFMGWLMHPSNEQQILLELHAQKTSQQQREAQESQLYNTGEAFDPEDELYVNAHQVTLRLETLQTRPGRNLLMTLIIGCLPFIVKIFESKSAGGDINDASVNENDTTRTEQERHQSTLQVATKRQKVNHNSVPLVTGREGWFTAINYYIKNGAWQCSGFDLRLKTWRTLPAFSYLPAPDLDLFKGYSVCGDGGLMCANVSKYRNKCELVVFNPMTEKTFALPPLLYPRNPVLVHMSVNSATNSYKVIVAGSSALGSEHLSKKMEVFDSKTSKWEETIDLPGPEFGLNEWQAGVCVNGILYFISFLEGDCPNCRKGVVAYDLENGQWLENLTCPLPCPLNSRCTLQLVKSNGEVYLFSEHERYREGRGYVEHRIDVLVEKCHLRNVVRVNKPGGRGLLPLEKYPEYTCVAFGEGKLCVFNTLTRDGVVYDMQDGKECEVLEAPPPEQKGEKFFSLNPATFTLQPRFDSDPIPLSVDAI